MASEGDALVAGGICQTPSYLSGRGKTIVQQEFRKQVEVFVENDLDFIICEVSSNVPTIHSIQTYERRMLRLCQILEVL